MSSKPGLPESIFEQLMRGVVIPAQPLALDADRNFDERRQRALTRYYCTAGAGGLAVGVHSTQFEIREPDIGLFEPVLSMAAETLEACEESAPGKPLIKVAGAIGKTAQAVKEAELARGLGYHAVLVSLAAFKEESNEAMVQHLDAVSDVLPVFGFYLQPSVGGRTLDYDFWLKAMSIPNLVAVKTAPFNRYATLEVARAIADGGRAQDLALYTGNDDNIYGDLLTTYRFGEVEVPFRGGLLGQWAVWTKKAVEDMKTFREMREQNQPIPRELMTRAQQMTDANAVIFDSANKFAGCIPGIHEVLRRQGLLEGTWTLNPEEVLSPGQKEEIDRVYELYPDLNDDDFVKEHLEDWMEG